jgi:hypothetical protein
MSSSTVKLQIPLDKSLRDAITKHAYELGFSSVQDFTRVMYSTVVRDDMQLSFTKSERLSPSATARYKEMIKEHHTSAKTGKAKTYTSVDSFLADL